MEDQGQTYSHMLGKWSISVLQTSLICLDSLLILKTLSSNVRLVILWPWPLNYLENKWFDFTAAMGIRFSQTHLVYFSCWASSAHDSGAAIKVTGNMWPCPGHNIRCNVPPGMRMFHTSVIPLQQCGKWYNIIFTSVEYFLYKLYWKRRLCHDSMKSIAMQISTAPPISFC